MFAKRIFTLFLSFSGTARKDDKPDQPSTSGPPAGVVPVTPVKSIGEEEPQKTDDKTTGLKTPSDEAKSVRSTESAEPSQSTLSATSASDEDKVKWESPSEAPKPHSDEGQSAPSTLSALGDQSLSDNGSETGQKVQLKSPSDEEKITLNTSSDSSTSSALSDKAPVDTTAKSTTAAPQTKPEESL